MRILFIFCLGLIYACTASTAGDIKKTSSLTHTNKKVLLELFTSQGCSSCPSADKLVSNLAGADTNLIVLSFHVDYWDRLGWKDPFSNHDYTIRQQQYVQALHAESPYTPQAVVQGEYEMVGSNKPGITNALTKVRDQSNDVMLTTNATLENATLDLHYEVDKTKSNQQLMVALVQIHASTSVQRGENSGVQLEGYNVVRSFETILLAQKSGKVKINLPPDLKKDNASVVVFVQDLSSEKIVVVTQIRI